MPVVRKARDFASRAVRNQKTYGVEHAVHVVNYVSESALWVRYHGVTSSPRGKILDLRTHLLRLLCSSAELTAQKNLPTNLSCSGWEELENAHLIDVLSSPQLHVSCASAERPRPVELAGTRFSTRGKSTHFVVGDGIGAGAERVITAAILVDVVEDGGCDTRVVGTIRRVRIRSSCRG